MPYFIAQLMTMFKLTDQDGLHDHLIDVPGEDIFNVNGSAAACEFCEWFQFGIDIRPCNNFQNSQTKCVMKYCQMSVMRDPYLVFLISIQDFFLWFCKNFSMA